MGRIIGIDLGTTNSAVAFVENSQPKIVPNGLGFRLTPSIVAFTSKGKILIGDLAKNQAVTNAERTIQNVKRDMGSDVIYKIDGKDYKPQYLMSRILAKLKEDSERFFGEKVNDAVITVPAYFSDAQRQATVDAGRIAGLNVVRIINEPTAAALAYGLHSDKYHNILVFDLGGGTFDVSVLELDGGIFEVKSTRGNNALGGIDFDRRLVEIVTAQFKNSTGIDLKQDPLAMQKIVEACEQAKIVLSSEDETEINVPFISADASGPKHLKFDLTRKEFEQLIKDLIDETVELSLMAVSDAGLDKNGIDRIILVGGSTRIPLVEETLIKAFGNRIHRGVDPEEAVALGAAIETGIITGELKGIVLLDVAPLSLGIEIEGGLFSPVIKRNSPIPNHAKKIFTTVTDNQDEVEVVVLQGENKNASDNILLGKFILSGIRKAARGVPRIEVQFDIDVDSIVHVSAKDLDTGLSQTIIINSKIGLTADELDILIRDSGKKDVVENEELRFIGLKNEARSILFRVDNLLETLMIDETFRREIDSLALEINKAIDERATDALEKLQMILIEFHEELVDLQQKQNLGAEAKKGILDVTIS